MSNKQEIDELKTALLKAKQDIEKLSKVKSDFISIISHELRTPLTSIKESLSLVLDELTGPLNEEQKRFLTMTRSNIDKLTNIIMDVLDFSRLDSGRIMMHKRKGDVNKIIENIHAVMADSAKRKNLQFNLEFSDGMEPVWFDPERIGQVLKSLVSNAIKFNEENGKIKISSSKQYINGKQVIKVSVEDTGIGISNDEMKGLFEQFEPVDTSMTRRHSGVGLGLVISKGIIQLHGGDIWVESKRETGSKFIFTLPIYKKDNEFNFLLDEALERARYAGLKSVMIIFRIKNQRDDTEKNRSRLEGIIRSVVRGPEDKVVRHRGGKSIVVMAGTDRCGAMKIIERLKVNVGMPLYYGIAVYPDEVGDNKEDLIKKAERELESKENSL